MSRLKYDQLLLSTLNNNEKLHAESFDYQAVFLSSLVPDNTNARFLPAILIEDEHAKQFINRKLSKQQLIKMYNAENHVIFGKSCVINCLKYESVDWKKANHTIESILELGDNIAVSELIQAPTIYPIEDGKFQILTGHRRFFALLYANGFSSVAQFKVYNTKPLLAKVKQFQENASREDLPQYGKLLAFLSAITEIDSLNSARIKVGMKKLTVKEIAMNLGISMGAYDNYNVLTRYNCVHNAYESGLSFPFIKTKKIILDIESAYKAEYKKTTLNLQDKKNIDEQIKLRLSNKKLIDPPQQSFRLKPIKSANTIKALLTSNIMHLDTGIDWSTLDWEDYSAVSKTMSKVIEFLENSQDVEKAN